jgi:hypothetical protein
MTTEQQILSNLIRNNFDKDKGFTEGLAWIAYAHVNGFTALHSELIQKQALRHGTDKMMQRNEAVELWGALTCKAATEDHFNIHRIKAANKGFRFAKDEYTRSSKKNQSQFNELAIYRMAQKSIL